MLTVPKEVLKSLTKVSTPPPWRKQSFPVGGLWTVGFGWGSDLLLVVSVNGRGVFDCLSGERVARDPSDDTYDEDSETTTGIGPLAGSRVEWSKIAEAEEVRAIGFSPTDRTLVVAEPHTLHVWCR